MQSVARRSSFYFEKVKNGNWEKFDPLFELGQELTGKTLGVFGLGRIGFEMAEKCKKAFGMKIIYHNRNHNEEAEKMLDAQYVSFEELVTQSDVLSVHANFKAEQNELFNAEVFNKMKPNAIFINTARGGFQNEKDLYQALINKKNMGSRFGCYPSRTHEQRKSFTATFQRLCASAYWLRNRRSKKRNGKTRRGKPCCFF